MIKRKTKGVSHTYLGPAGKQKVNPEQCSGCWLLYGEAEL